MYLAASHIGMLLMLLQMLALEDEQSIVEKLQQHQHLYYHYYLYFYYYCYCYYAVITGGTNMPITATSNGVHNFNMTVEMSDRQPEQATADA